MNLQYRQTNKYLDFFIRLLYNIFRGEIKMLKIKEIPSIAEQHDFIFALCTFLDEFYHSDIEEKKSLLVDEPQKGTLDKRQYCILAAAAHKLANEYNFSIPEWSMKKKYIMPYPVYAFNAQDTEDRELLKITSLDEFKMRNLFLGSKILKRV